ncbi:MAG: ABC transporter permease [Bacteroidota bacterium]|nr:ABC transporter permease [Bacteroidota bacterium]MDP3143967.1 ABC transporter permease [Bacteroidota bacterium]MDP3557534.1 ABC transporter permease [Bacteroidota bacterium]
MFFKKKSINFESESLSAQTWRRFKRNKLSLLGLWTIIVSCLISILGYLITPDQTLYANDQKPELHIKAPGFGVRMLSVFKNQEKKHSNMFSTMLFGKDAEFSYYTIHDYKFKGQNIIVEEYTGNVGNERAAISTFNIADVIYAIDTKYPIKYDSIKNELSFYEIGNSIGITKSVSELQNTIKEENVINKTYLLGTDLLGRDLLSRLLIGTRISLSVGLVSVIISIFIGILLGAIAGYYRGKTDSAIMWLINVVWSIPTLLLVIAITLVLGKGILQVFIAVGLTMWVDVARIVRGQILSIREKEFVEAGRALGFKNMRIVLRHILPNVMGPVVVMAASNFASAILTEAGLSFLGIGAQPPVPSWGEMVSSHHGYILMDKAYLAFIPGIAIMILVLAFMLVGNGLRDALDTRTLDEKPIAGN